MQIVLFRFFPPQGKFKGSVIIQTTLSSAKAAGAFGCKASKLHTLFSAAQM